MLQFIDTPRTELVPGLPFGEYCSHPGISQSFLKTFDIDLGGCPALARHNYLFPECGSPSTLAKDFGTALHYYVLDRGRFNSRYEILTQELKVRLLSEAKATGSRAKWFSRQVGTYQQWKAEIEERGKIEIDEKEVAVLEEMAYAMTINKDVFGEILQCQYEVSAFAASFNIPLQLKARFDLLQSGNGDAIIDLKTCRSANPGEFAGQVARLGYDIQAAFYVDMARRNGRDIKRFGFLAQDKFPPYLCCIHWLPEQWIGYGRIRYRKILLDVAEAIRTDSWPGYSTGMLEPPAWLMPQLEAVSA